MAYIKLIPESEAKGLLARIYEAAVRRAGKVFNILKLQSNNAASLQASIDLYVATMHADSPLTRAQREMLAVVVSRANDCHY
jgi:alkylhydroperoxidase family enzyme